VAGQVGDRGADIREEAATSRCAERRHKFRSPVREAGCQQAGHERGVVGDDELDVAATDLARKCHEVDGVFPTTYDELLRMSGGQPIEVI